MAFSPQEWSDDIRTKGQTCSKSCWNVSRFSTFFNSTLAPFNALDTTCSGRRRTTLNMVMAIVTKEWVPKPWVQRRTIGAGAMEKWTPTWATWWTLWTTWWGTMGWDLVCLCYVCVCFVFEQCTLLVTWWKWDEILCVQFSHLFLYPLICHVKSSFIGFMKFFIHTLPTTFVWKSFFSPKIWLCGLI